MNTANQSYVMRIMKTKIVNKAISVANVGKRKMNQVPES